jgi:hypothetical protein
LAIYHDLADQEVMNEAIKIMDNNYLLLEFLNFLKNYFNNKGVKVLIIFDNFNRLETLSGENFQFFLTLMGFPFRYCNHLFIYSSNNDKNLKRIVTGERASRIIAGRVFGQEQTRKLIKMKYLSKVDKIID